MAFKLPVDPNGLDSSLSGSREVETVDDQHNASGVRKESVSCSGGEKLLSQVAIQLCANPECGAKNDLQRAPHFVCAYFGLPVEKQKSRRVCKVCFQQAENHQNELVQLLKEHKPIVLGPKTPQNHMVTIDDEESLDEAGVIDEEVEIEGDIKELVESIMASYQFEKQIEASAKHLDQKTEKCNAKIKELDSLHSQLEKDLDMFRKELYSAFEPRIEHLEAVDIDARGNVSKHSSVKEVIPGVAQLRAPTSRPPAVLPPIGPFVHSPVKLNQTVYAMRSSLLAPWGRGRIVKMKESGEMLYYVRFDTGGKPRSFPLKYLAYAEPSPVQLVVGSRVIAQYVEDKDGKPKSSYSYYAGVIAEAPKNLNQYRYLVFFDDGYAQYCTHEQVSMVCHSSRDVWHDIHPNSRPFVSNYLKQFPERAMVKLQRGQSVKTELDGEWFQCRVESVDASLAYIHFVAANRFEWIYRGSTRLHPLFELLANAEARKSQGATRPTHNLSLVHKRKNTPYVEYTRGDVEPLPVATAQNRGGGGGVAETQKTQESLPNTKLNAVRAVAKKSTSKVLKSPPFSPSSIRSDDYYGSTEHKGRIKCRPNDSYVEMVFEPHQCGSMCIQDYPFADGDFKNYNPLAVPMFCGWSREVTKTRHGTRRGITYRGPCGRRMRNMDEVHRYLRLTGCQLGVDLFCFDSFVHCFHEFEPEVVYSSIRDITYGVENVRVSCVNSIDRSNPEYVEYSTRRTPREGVNLNLDPSFLVCCDCTDDCQDKDKCACWQLTLNATTATSGKINRNAGYQYRRLMDNVPTGVYECNSQCSCRTTCLNRVAQRPLQLRLQLFRTEKRGWGIRCLDDVPKGEFICVYAGQLLTDQEANDDGKQLGDEYLAELDLIETIEQAKDGYESDVTDIDQQSDSSQESSSDGESDGSSSIHSEIRTAGSDKAKVATSVEVNSKPNALSATSSSKPVKEIKVPIKKTREFYGANEHCYVMDAKTTGNIGRYLNHSCSPNVLVQNVFVDTQDLRFPWVAFFARCYIRAGTELTWDYSYQVGSVPDKILYCYCATNNCRGRLL